MMIPGLSFSGAAGSNPQAQFGNVTGGGSVPRWLWILGAVLLVAAGVWFILRRR